MDIDAGMNAPHHPHYRDAQALPFGNRAAFGQPLGGAVSIKWAALQDAGSAVAIIAGLPQEKPHQEIRNFTAMLRAAPDPVRRQAERGIDDLAAVMEPGLAALLAVKARGVDAGAPARALWLEFTAARNELIGLLPRTGTLGPPRSA